jgi:hypothetical protein
MEVEKEVSSNGYGNDARIVNKRLRLSSLNSLHVTLTHNRNGLRGLNLNPFTGFLINFKKGGF